MTDHETEMTLRPCGVAEEKLFEYLDMENQAAARSEFARHLTDCAECRLEVNSYRSLHARLTNLRLELPRGFEPRASFDAVVMAQLPFYGPATTSAARPGWFRRWLEDPVRVRIGLGTAVGSLFTGLALIAQFVYRAGGPRHAMAQTFSEAVRVGVDLLNSVVGQLLMAVHTSDALLGVSRLLKPLWGAAVTVSGAMAPEFWLVTTLLSLLALLGAVRLAAGSAEREVHHVHFCL